MLTKLGEETKFKRLGEETKFNKLGDETKPLMDETYPEVPKPTTVDAKRVSKKLVLTKFTKLGVETRFKRFAVDT